MREADIYWHITKETGFYWVIFIGFDERPEVAYYDNKRDIWLRTGYSAHYTSDQLLKIGLFISKAKFGKPLYKKTCTCGKTLFTKNPAQKYCNAKCHMKDIKKNTHKCKWCGEIARDAVFYQDKPYHENCLKQRQKV